MSLTALVLSDLADAIAKNSLLKAIEDVANNVNLAIAQINTNTAAVAAVNLKFTNMTDPVTITIATLTQDAINAAFVTDATQKKLIISTLKA
jgi:hypothetical protein